MKINNQNGFTYDPKDAKIAREAKLTTLPSDLQNGINCSNCIHFEAVQDGVGLCNHPDVGLPVTNAMCCAHYENPEEITS